MFTTSIVFQPRPEFPKPCGWLWKTKPLRVPSRRVLWLKVGTTNNDPNFIAHFYLQTVETINGCQKLYRTDRGTENTIMAGIQCFFRRNGNDRLSRENAHRDGSSLVNQRIESWWAQLKSLGHFSGFYFFKNWLKMANLVLATNKKNNANIFHLKN